MPKKPVDPTRFAIRGVMDRKEDLKAFVQSQQMDEHLKAFIVAELGELKTNAAEIHLFDIKRPDGGFDMHLTITGVQMGPKPNSVHRPLVPEPPDSPPSGTRITGGI